MSIGTRFFQATAMAAVMIGAGAISSGAFAQEAALRLTSKDHRFQPAEVHTPAGKPISIEVKNLDSTPAEFESKTLRVEKVIAGGATVTITGSGFGVARGIGVVRFGKKACTKYLSWSATHIKVQVPAKAAFGKLKVTVRAWDGVSGARSFTVRR